jgi:hypothetical protein
MRVDWRYFCGLLGPQKEVISGLVFWGMPQRPLKLPQVLVCAEPSYSSRGDTQLYRPEPRTLPAQGRRELHSLSTSPRKDEQRTAPELPRPPPSQGSRGQLTSIPPYHSFSSPSLSPFTIGKATRAHPALAIYLASIGRGLVVL